MSRNPTPDNPIPNPHPDDWGPREFKKIGFASYSLTVPRAFLTFSLTRLRRHSQELFGELSVRCELAGAKTFEGILSAGDFNCSSVQARSTRAKLLAGRAMTRDIDFEGYLEELCLRVIDFERKGEPAEVLRDVEVKEDAHGEFEVLGLRLPKRHPSILFGDGGSAKSMIALYTACELAHAGEVVMYCDWEATAQDHKLRLDMLYPANPPAVLYVRCEQPLTTEADRLRALVVEFGVTYIVLDSAAYGCGGAPESAEVALDYFRALRSLGEIGGLLVAHVTKADDGDKRPFGSGFWHNSARSTWHIARETDQTDDRAFIVHLTPRKSNFGKLGSALNLELTFGQNITIRPTGLLASPEFVPKLKMSQRIMATLGRKPLSIEQLFSEIPSEKPESIERSVRRFIEKGTLVKFQRPGGKEVIGFPDDKNR